MEKPPAARRGTGDEGRADSPELVTAASVSNAVTVLQALGGSTNAVIHLVAMAGRAGIRLDLGAIDRAGRTTPVLADLKPIGAGFMEDFHHAGALPALMRRLRNSLDLSAIAGDGRQLGDVLDAWPALDGRPRHSAARQSGRGGRGARGAPRITRAGWRSVEACGRQSDRCFSTRARR